MTSGNAAKVVYQDNQSPFGLLWAAHDSFQVRLRGPFRVSQPSVLVFGFGVPNMDDTTATLQSILQETQWGQVKYAESMVERAMLHLLGLVEAGAETPWVEATQLLQLHMDPDVFEEDAALFGTELYRVFTEFSATHQVPGRLKVGSLTTGR